MSKKADRNWGRVWSQETEMDCRVALQHLATAVYHKWSNAINSESKYPDLVGLGQIHDIWNGMYEDMKALYALEQLCNNHYKTKIIDEEEARMEGLKTSEEVIAGYRPRIEEWLRYAYNDGYRCGFKNGRGDADKLRGTCVREADANDSTYADGWDDYTLFYGWCSQCKRPHSGRWAHMWEYCPWCGAKVVHTDNDPYPTGMRSIGGKFEKLLQMCGDVNPDEIAAHDTEDSLRSWCGAWQREVKKLIRAIEDGEG